MPRARLLKETQVFDYEDYRAFLRDAYAELKGRDAKYSYRFLARRGGLASWNLLRMVMIGTRNATEDAARKFAKGFGLSADETEFFLLLVAMNQAKNDAERDRVARRITASRAYRKHRLLQAEQFEYIAEWYHLAIRELASLPDFQDDPRWIAERLWPEVDAKQAARALERMQEIGVLVRDADGDLAQAEPFVTTGPELGGVAARSFHRAMMGIASQAIEHEPPERRDISGLTVAISQTQADRIKARIKLFRKELLEMVAEDEAPDQVYQLNMQWFRLTTEERREGK